MANFVNLLFTLLFGTAVKGCFPLYGAGTCGGGGGTFCPPASSSYPVPAYAPPPSPYSAYPASPYQSQYAAQPYHASKSRTMASSSDQFRADSCLRRFPDTRLVCALPFERRTPSDESECQSHCIDAWPRCRTFQYDPLGSVCDLFDYMLAPEATTTNSLETTDGGWKEEMKKKRRQRRRRFVLHNGVPLDTHSQWMLSDGKRRGAAAMAGIGLAGTSSSYSSPSTSSSSLSNCVPSLESRTGVLFVAIEADCDPTSIRSSLDSNDLDLPIPSPSPAPSTIGQLEPMPAAKPYNRRAEPIRTTTTMGTVVEEEKDCQDGARARIQLIDGIALVGQKLLVAIQLDSADVCLHVCRQNAHLDGLPFPAQCRSATFHRQSGRCEILGQAISPNGPLQYVPNPDSLYFEKICLPKGDLPLACDDLIHRIPQHHLDPRPIAGSGTVFNAPNQLECIRKCIASKASFGFECNSASFFFDWSTQNCFLSRFTRLSRPDMYSAERKELVDYMEMPPCFQLTNAIRQHDPPPASAWSDCIGGMRWRKKANCTGENNKNGCAESEECHPTTGEVAAKQVAPSIEVAKRFRAPAVASEEASLFGEQDYENQKEISFFGPPQKVDEEEKDGENHILAESPSSCDPSMGCCPLMEELGGPKGIVRGCSLGKRQLADGRMVSCVPDKCQ